MKIYQQLEQVYKFRIFSNEEITPYLIKLSKMGKIDEPKKIAMFTIILDKLGQMEDEAESKEAEIMQQIEDKFTYLKHADSVEEEISLSGHPDLSKIGKPNDSVEDPSVTAPETTFAPPPSDQNILLVCHCGKTAKTTFGLTVHQRSHKAK